MRFPGLKSRKSSSGAPSTSPSNIEGAALQPVSSNDRNGNTSSTSSSLLSRWKSNASGVDEHGVLRSSDTASHPAPPASASTTTTANTGKRSFFSRKSHSRSLSYGAQEVLQNNVDTSSHSGHATISTAAAATTAGGHPLRQHTLPADLDATPQKPKRPGLSFPKRGFTTADLSSTPHSEPDLPRKSTASSSYHAGSPTTYAFDSTDSSRPLSHTQDSPASRSSDSFQLKSFRSVTGVREEPTLSSLVDAELTSSPLSTRPSSPATAPVTSSSTSSYFDSRSAGGSTASGSRTPTYSNASISVSRFREAKAARSISSLNSNASQSTAQRQPSGLKLDLPPPITLEYPSRPVLNIVQADSRSPPPSRPATPANHNGTSEALSRASSASPSRESYSTAYHTLHASPPRMASPTSPLRSASPSLNSHEDRQPAMHPLAVHPDNALPLPPVPADPEQQQRQHRRTQSNQSISSLSASLGGWLNSTSTSFGLSFSAEDVQKTFAEKAAALRNRTPSVKDGLGLGLGGVSPNRSLSQQQPQPEEEIILSPAQMGPTGEELAILLGGKVLPPPPSETGDDYDPRALPVRASPTMQSSPKFPLSRASSFSNLAFGSNLFASAFTKVAKPAKDDDDDVSEDWRDVSLVKATQSTQPVRSTRASNAFNASDTSSDEAVSDDEEGDSDDSETRARKKEKSLVFPPPRPTNEADRQRIYQAALTPPALTPQGSSSDLKAYIQVCGEVTHQCGSASLTHTLQPVPQTAPLTSANIKSLNDDDDDEDVPLSTIKIRAQSEIGLASPQLRPSAVPRGKEVPFGGSAIGVTSKSPFDDRRGRIREKHASSSSLAVPTATSTGMPRSLSAFSTTVSEMGATSHQMQTRSASSQALSTLPSASRLPRHVSLSSLIELEAKSATASLPGVQKKGSTSSSRPSNSSDGSFPPTPSDSVYSASHRASPKPTLFTPTHLSPIRKHGSQQRGHRATTSDLNGLRQDDLSAADGRTKASQHAKEDHRKSAALLNRNPPSASGNSGLDNPLPSQAGFAPSGWSLSPQALQAMPAPPGVDPILYASLPPDQKLNLQMRAQQLLSLMQSMALQASSGTLGRPNSQPSQQFMGPSLLPMQMQMPMMGSAVPAFPPFPNFFGMPAGFPNSMPFMSNVAPTTQPYQTFTAPSAVGQPTLFQQAGLSAPGATAQIPGSRRDFQRQRRESQ